ncbi:hypothetical protein Smp_184870 [Schistosoma mansoni]|uniref:hypothetical protein n=1 Tax=Schistosoma mansoni TaxID=6183 RepID=UPI00019B369D|nr:hypothetical protein Smp_184590 [Schistosoma mansoni]XP_018644541.1 hypothetical protein Smp_184870 [Schistosoma mansoni]|eukprot:XP_018644539.1 hypothetical protein Smp_184590 [Schistosoma mansoni]
MRGAAYLCIVAGWCCCDDVSVSVCGGNAVHTWIEEAVSKRDDAFECVVVLDKCAHAIAAFSHAPSQMPHSIHTPSFQPCIASSSPPTPPPPPPPQFALSIHTYNCKFSRQFIQHNILPSHISVFQCDGNMFELNMI